MASTLLVLSHLLLMFTTSTCNILPKSPKLHENNSYGFNCWIFDFILEEEDLSLYLLQRIGERFKRRNEAANGYLQPQNMHELVSSFAEVLTEHTPGKISASRWERLLWKDPEARRQIRNIHHREIGEFKAKQTLLLKSAELLMDAYRRCLDGSFGERVKEELISLSPVFFTAEGLIRLLCIEAVLSRESLSEIELFSHIAPSILQRLRRQMKGIEGEKLSSLLLDEGQSIAADALKEVVRLAFKTYLSRPEQRENANGKKKAHRELSERTTFRRGDLKACIPEEPGKPRQVDR